MDNPVINEYGDTCWYDSDGELHRDDGPAVIYANGDKWWLQYSKLHRDDGPAWEYADGTNRWWLNDNLLSFDEWLDQVDISDEDKVMMKLIYG